MSRTQQELTSNLSQVTENLENIANDAIDSLISSGCLTSQEVGVSAATKKSELCRELCFDSDDLASNHSDQWLQVNGLFVYRSCSCQSPADKQTRIREGLRKERESRVRIPDPSFTPSSWWLSKMPFTRIYVWQSLRLNRTLTYQTHQHNCLPPYQHAAAQGGANGNRTKPSRFKAEQWLSTYGVTTPTNIVDHDSKGRE